MSLAIIFETSFVTRWKPPSANISNEIQQKSQNSDICIFRVRVNHSSAAIIESFILGTFSYFQTIIDTLSALPFETFWIIPPLFCCFDIGWTLVVWAAEHTYDGQKY